MHLTIETKKYGVIGYTIDDEDYHLLEGWRATVIRMKDKYYYIQLQKRGEKQYLHRLIMGNPEGYDIDHINHNTLDNRKENLRLFTRSENSKNREHRKLSKDAVTFIRACNLSNNVLARMFNVSNCLISKVKNYLMYDIY